MFYVAMDTKEIENIIECLLVPTNNKPDALPSKKDTESSIQIVREKIAVRKTIGSS